MKLWLSASIAFLVALFVMFLLRPLAKRISFVDEPGGRKQHCSPIPLTGGIGIFSGFLFSLLTLQISLLHFRSLIAATAILVFVGILDDFHELSARARFIAQIIAGLIMTLWGANIVFNLGDLVFIGNIYLHWIGIPFTIIAVIGVINAINMLDGIDGLAGSLCLVQLSFLAILAYKINFNIEVQLLVIAISALLAYLVLNIPLPGRKKAKVFMGDAGSMFLGFLLTWFLVSLSQTPHKAAEPVVMLWICAVPLFDITTVVINRLVNRNSPLQADRSHIHHELKRLGLKDSAILLIIISFAIIMASIGLLAEFFNVQQGELFIGFIILFSVYYFVVHWLRKNNPRFSSWTST